MKKLDLTGHTYNYLTVVAPAPKTGRDFRWKCNCTCGAVVSRTTSDLRGKSISSCGCHRTKHGEAGKSKLYMRWSDMKTRCKKTTGSKAHLYANKGITYLAAWEEFAPFKDWANSNGYEEGLSLDRIDSDLGYSPENCRWVTATTQSRNRKPQGGTSKYIGVYWNSNKNSWDAGVHINNKHIYVGRFTSEKEAAIARDTYIINNKFRGFTLNKDIFNDRQD